MLKIYRHRNVLEAALHRLRWLYTEFEHIYVSFSGGKDSTVLLNLAIMAAEAEGRLPVHVMFIDQEAEWQTVIDYIRETFSDPRVVPHWFQMPFRLFNATSNDAAWLQCWDPGVEWMRPKEPNAITENVYGTDRFKPLFSAILKHDFPNSPACNLAGMRAQENPARRLGFTLSHTYKGVTWGSIGHTKRGHYLFCPLYDWMTRDIWTAITKHDWTYCPLYDRYYQYGLGSTQMRVSSVSHEQGAVSLRYLQELEPDTWDALERRLPGINSAGHLGKGHRPTDLPRGFADWWAYRDHLLEHMIEDPVLRAKFRQQFAASEQRFDPYYHHMVVQAEIDAICVNDYHGTILDSFALANLRYMRRSFVHANPDHPRGRPERVSRVRS